MARQFRQPWERALSGRIAQGNCDHWRYLTAHHLPQEHALLPLDGQYGNEAVLADVVSFAFVIRGKDYHLLDHPLIQARLHLPPISSSSIPKVKWSAASTIAPRSR